MQKLGIVVLVLMLAASVFAVQSASAKENVTVGYGVSTKADAIEAAEEAVASVKSQMGGVSPEWAVIYSTVGYDSNVLLTHVRDLLGSDIKIWGETSHAGVMSKDGFHKGGPGAVAILAVSSPKMSFGVGAADLDKFSSQEAGKKAVLAALKDAGKRRNAKPQMILMCSPLGVEHEVILGIEEVTGKDVPIFGGATADETLEGLWKMFANDQVLSNSVVTCVIFSDLKMGWVMQHGCHEDLGLGRGIITKADGFTIHEIDNRPAGEVYNEWIDGELTSELTNGSNNICSGFTCSNPTAVIKRDKDDKIIHYLVKTPLAFPDPVNKPLKCFAQVYEGDEICLVRGTGEMMIRRPKTNAIVARARGKISKNEVAFAVNGQCLCTLLTVNYEGKDIQTMAPMVNPVLGGAPWIGAYTLGEQGYLKGIGNRHVNEVSWMVVFGKE